MPGVELPAAVALMVRPHPPELLHCPVVGVVQRSFHGVAMNRTARNLYHEPVGLDRKGPHCDWPVRSIVNGVNAALGALA